jgi:hypothetical protein
MEIQRITEAYQLSAYGRNGPKTKKTEPTNNAADKVKESVELSPSSINLQKVKEAVKALPEIRIPIVEEIMQRIKNNDYPISRHAEDAIDNMIKGSII